MRGSCAVILNVTLVSSDVRFGLLLERTLLQSMCTMQGKGQLF
jgi:hypothetical protein